MFVGYAIEVMERVEETSLKSLEFSYGYPAIVGVNRSTVDRQPHRNNRLALYNIVHVEFLELKHLNLGYC